MMLMNNLGGRLDTPAVDESKETDATGRQHSDAEQNHDEENGSDHPECEDDDAGDDGENLSSGGSHSGKSSLTEYLANVRETMVAVQGLTMMHSAHNLITMIMMNNAH